MALQNAFLSVYQRLNTGDAAEQYVNIPPFPLLLDVELTNICNFHCRMCETGMGTSPRVQGLMSETTFTTILEEASQHGTALRFIRWGEPTLHPQWLDWMQRAKNAGLLVHMNTNGSRLDEDALHRLVEIGVDSVKFSFQGVDRATYTEMRDTDFFDTLMQRIARLKILRKDRPAPWIQISTTILNESPEAVENFRTRALEVADYVNVGFTIVEEVHMEALKEADKIVHQNLLDKQYTLKRPSFCAEVFAKLSIDWDGTVTSCCSDNRQTMSVGHLRDNSLQEIWTGEKQRRHQKILSANNFEALELCRKCYESMPR